MAPPVSRRPGTGNHPSSAQEVDEEEFPIIDFEQDNEQEREALAQA